MKIKLLNFSCWYFDKNLIQSKPTYCHKLITNDIKANIWTQSTRVKCQSFNEIMTQKILKMR